jgi:hypothetical protein
MSLFVRGYHVPVEENLLGLFGSDSMSGKMRDIVIIPDEEVPSPAF